MFSYQVPMRKDARRGIQEPPAAASATKPPLSCTITMTITTQAPVAIEPAKTMFCVQRKRKGLRSKIAIIMTALMADKCRPCAIKRGRKGTVNRKEKKHKNTRVRVRQSISRLKGPIFHCGLEKRSTRSNIAALAEKSQTRQCLRISNQRSIFNESVEANIRT